MRDFRELGHRSISSESPPATWIQWLITIPLRGVCVPMMLIPRVAKQASGPIILQLSIPSILKKLFPDVPVVIGGIEASMRRLTPL
ncbi:MAG: hypothetical protein MZV63_36915 [Marinilabiliales bacterium]|nr:hypothetical protein [Marinilabiliales bacterium]